MLVVISHRRPTIESIKVLKNTFDIGLYDAKKIFDVCKMGGTYKITEPLTVTQIYSLLDNGFILEKYGSHIESYTDSGIMPLSFVTEEDFYIVGLNNYGKDNYISCIKAWREITSWGLKETKDFLDDMRHRDMKKRFHLSVRAANYLIEHGFTIEREYKPSDGIGEDIFEIK